MGILSSLVSGAFSLVGQKMASNENRKERNFNAQQAQINREFQTSEREASQSYNTMMWEKNNEYNSISSQVQRAIDAGINPNALFSSQYSPAQSSPPTTTPMSGSAASYSSSLGSSLLNSFAQNALTLAQVNKTESEADLNKYELSWNRMTESERFDALKKQNAKFHAEVRKIFSDIGMNDFNKDMQERTYRWFASKTSAEIDVIKEQLNVLRNQSLDILKGIDMKDAQIKDLLASVDVKKKQMQVADADIALKGSQKLNVEAQTEGQEIDNAIQEVVKKWSDITGIPLNASDAYAMFALWKEGKFEDVSTLLHINDANNSGGSELGEVRKSATRLLMGLEQLFSGFNGGNKQLESTKNP